MRISIKVTEYLEILCEFFVTKRTLKRSSNIVLYKLTGSLLKYLKKPYKITKQAKKLKMS